LKAECDGYYTDPDINDFIDGTLKEQLQIADGNLASHISTETLKYIHVKNSSSEKPNTSYAASKAGKKHSVNI
jgi:hypothetical protein